MIKNCLKALILAVWENYFKPIIVITQRKIFKTQAYKNVLLLERD